ncbi:MAG: monovalent cation/H(+) antiporter subunit G [Rhizobiaceae bacterium]|nr:monovalent cation/H(+) antiporter subunit G [Rhizobiaceae bacterium]
MSIDDVCAVLAGLLMLTGSAFTLVAAIGLLRLPDLYTRMHAASKAGSVGVGLILLALALVADGWPEALRALAAILFFLLTTPISAHLLAKAAHGAGYALWKGSVRDDMSASRARGGAADNGGPV